MKIKLNIAEQRLAKYLAKKRYENARRRGKPNMKMGEQSDEQTDLEGVGAEIAYCKAMNVYPDLETDLDKLPSEDAILANGISVDVKSTTYSNGRLLVTLKKSVGDVDMYVLVTGRFPEYQIIGTTLSENVFKAKNIKNLGRGDGYVIEQKDLILW